MWSASEVALLCELARNHTPGSEIARQVGRSYAAVLQKARQMGERIGQPRTLRRAWTTAESDRLIELASTGITRIEAAALMGRGAGILRAHARALGLDWVDPAPPVREPKGLPPRPWTAEEDRRLSELATQGVPIGLAANHMDRAYNTVVLHARRLRLSFERDRLARTRHRRT